MNKTELESKHLAELHELAAKAGLEHYRMLSRAELIEKLDDGKGGGRAGSREGGSDPSRRRAREERPRQERREEKPRQGGRQRPRREEAPRGGRRRPEPSGSEPERTSRPSRPEPEPKPASRPPRPEAAAAEPAAAGRPKRKRRRRRWGRRRKGVRVHDLLLPGASGRQAIVYAESREICTTLLREVAAELSDASGGPDPIALLIDPSPEELADWKREAPQAEIVAAGQARHANDAIAQAALRANGGEDVIVLIDSLSRFAESDGDARELLDAALSASQSASGSLTVVASVERAAR